MYHTAAIVASLASLGLTCTIYYCNILSRPGSWPRSEVLATVLLALLTGLFPLAVGAAAVGLWTALTGGASVAALFAGATDLASVAAIVATGVVFRALVRATNRTAGTPTSVAPFPTRPRGTTTPRMTAA